jgi:hypothetical protein
VQVISASRPEWLVPFTGCSWVSYLRSSQVAIRKRKMIAAAGRMCQPCQVTGSRPLLVWAAVAAAVLVAAAAVVAIVLTGGDDERPEGATQWTRPPVSCPPDARPLVIAYFDAPGADDDMRQAMDRLRDDHQIRALLTESQHEAYTRYRDGLADPAELPSTVRPETTPASLSALPVDGVSLSALADHLRAALPEADLVQPGGCAVPVT